MKKYEKQVQQAYLDSEKEVLKKIEANYRDALNEIDDKIAMLLARQDADMQHVIYQVEYQKALKGQIQGILDTLQANEFETVSEYLATAYEDGYIGTMYSLQSQGVPLVIPIDQEQVVNALQNETNLSENLYKSFDMADLKKKISGEISRGIATAAMYSEIARNIEGYARISKNNAMRIARTEAHRIQCRATMDACNKAKDKGADVVKQWDASLDGKTRDSHRQVDGEIRELDEKFSNGLMYPGDPSGRAEEVINCRCALLQRAKWALGNDYTKWAEDAPELISDDGTTQFVNIKAKDYNDFKKQYMKASALMLNSEKDLENNGKSSKMKLNLEFFASKTQHATERASERNIADASIDDAIENPLYKGNVVVSEDGRKSVKYIGKDTTVIMNPDTKEVITTWKTGSRVRKKYEGK